MREYNRKNKEALAVKRKLNPSRSSISRRAERKYSAKLRRLALDAYGNACACCGEMEEKFLTIDHVNGDGNIHRKTVRDIYAWLRNQGYPKEGFRILCMNCNWATRYGDLCPHRTARWAT